MYRELGEADAQPLLGLQGRLLHIKHGNITNSISRRAYARQIRRQIFFRDYFRPLSERRLWKSSFDFLGPTSSPQDIKFGFNVAFGPRPG